MIWHLSNSRSKMILSRHQWRFWELKNVASTGIQTHNFPTQIFQHVWPRTVLLQPLASRGPLTRHRKPSTAKFNLYLTFLNFSLSSFSGMVFQPRLRLPSCQFKSAIFVSITAFVSLHAWHLPSFKIQQLCCGLIANISIFSFKHCERNRVSSSL